MEGSAGDSPLRQYGGGRPAIAGAILCEGILGVYVVYVGEYYFKKMRVKLAKWSGKVQ